MKNKKLYAAIGATVLICAAAAGFYFSSLAYRLNRLAARQRLPGSGRPLLPVLILLFMGKENIRF